MTSYEQDEILGAGMIPADLVAYLGNQRDISVDINTVRFIESTSKELMYVVKGSRNHGFHETIKGFVKSISVLVVKYCES